MSDWVHEHLEDSKKTYDAILIPSGLQSAVNAGIQSAVSARKSRLRLFAVSAAAILFLTFFIGGVRISPAFASYVSQIPGMEKIVQMISNDKGLQLAIDHNLLQPIHVSDSHDGVSLTVDNIIKDEARLVVFYTLEGSKATSDTLNDIQLLDIQLLDEKGKTMQIGAQTFTAPLAEGAKGRSNFIDVMIYENISTPKHVTLSFSPRSKVDSKKWQVSFDLDPDKAHNPKKVLSIDKSITIGGQIIHIDKATIYPTRLLLEVSFDEMNSKQIFELLDLKLVDDKGREWKRGNFSSQINDHHQSLYFESMYFAEPKRLTLQGTGISALDEDELNVIIDPESGALLKAPAGLSFMGSSAWGKDLRVNFRVINFPEGYANLSFSKMTDGSGHPYQLGDAGWSTRGEYNESWAIITDAANAIGPLTLRIGSYPMTIKAAFEAEIPLR
jgi:hypothetical protein